MWTSGRSCTFVSNQLQSWVIIVAGKPSSAIVVGSAAAEGERTKNCSSLAAVAGRGAKTVAIAGSGHKLDLTGLVRGRKRMFDPLEALIIKSIADHPSRLCLFL